MSDPSEALPRLVGYFKLLPTAGVKHYDASYLDHLAAVFRGLQAWGAGAEECGAGFFHSIYGTEVFRGFILDLDRREGIVGLIGHRAEAVAYANCFMDRYSFDEAVASAGGPPHRFRNWLTGETFEMEEAEFGMLCRIHLFDWLEQVPRGGRGNYRREAYRKLAGRLGGAALEAHGRVYAMEGRPRLPEAGGYRDA